MRTRLCQAIFAVLPIAFSTMGCDSSSRATVTTDSPVLTIADSVQLQDPDPIPLGTPGDYVHLRNGGFLIADPQNNRILEYDADGAVVRSIGHKGAGPGEFQRLVSVALDGDSVLYALEPGLVSIFDYRTGEFREKAKLSAPFTFSVAVKNSKLYFRGNDSAQAPVLSVWSKNSVTNGPQLPSPTTLQAVKSAGDVEIAKMMNATHGAAVLEPLNGDTIAVLSQASEDILIATPAQLVRQIPVARTKRQGVREDLIARIAADPSIAERDPQVVYMSSLPTAVRTNASGEFYTVKTDLTFLGKRLGGKLFLSVTEPRNGRTCPDALIPGPEDPRPVVTFSGDSLFVMSQDVQGTSAATVIRKYFIDTKGCDWRDAVRSN